MKGRAAFLCLTLLSSFIIASPLVSGSQNLIDSGETQIFKSEIVYTEVMNDNTILLLESNGKISQNTHSQGVLTPLWDFQLNVTAFYAKLDFGETLLAVLYNSGFLTFNINTQMINENTTLSTTPDSIDWDADGDIWVGYHNGQRKAKEYSNGESTNEQTSTISSGFFCFEILDNDYLAFGAFDQKIHLFNQNGNLVTQLNEPTSYLSTFYEDENGILLAGSGDGKLHIYDVNNSYAHSQIDIGSDLIEHIQDFDDSHYAVFSGNNLHLINKIDFSKTEPLPSINSGSMYVFSDPGGQLSVLFNYNDYGAITYYDLDSDGDGFSDIEDIFPSDPTQHMDSDNDGYGDNILGTNGDEFPFNPEQYVDSDDDGYGDNKNGLNGDQFPSNPEQWQDSDGDGYGDNSNGLFGDRFVDDATQWNDTDFDTFGDNPNGNTPDSCPTVSGFSTEDRFGCVDSDLDYYSNPDDEWSIEDGADALPYDGTQWNDLDGDGFGDNPSPANNPDSCLLVPGNSTKEIRIDGMIIDKYGCLDTDGDSYEDASDEFPTDPTEWYDSDGDGVGANLDYDDTEFLISTEEDYCRVSGNQSTACNSWNDLDYQDYLSRDKSPEEADLSYSSWLLNEQAKSLSDSEETLSSTIKDVVLIGGIIFAIATVGILLASFVMKKRKLNKLVKRYGVPFEPKDSSASKEALEDSAGLSAIGGIDSDDAWDDEVDEMDFSDKNDEDEIIEENQISAEELYDSESDISEIAGIDIAAEETSEEEVSAMLTDDESEEEKPSNAPPLPASGLPEGWTMDQWEWYGHEWLSKYGDE